MTKFPLEVFERNATPFYYYDLALLERTLKDLRAASGYPGFRVHYALKANTNPEILDLIASQGLGADTVSIWEIREALKAGFPADSIVFAGVGKTDAEIEEALEEGIGCFNVESQAELDAIEAIAARMKKKAPVALRVNPEIDAHTHHYITTGLAENKFGVAMQMLPDLLERTVNSEWLDLRGLHFHIGSQVTDFEPYRLLCERINVLQDRFAGFSFDTINVGGGLGIDYEDPDGHPVPDFKPFFEVFHRHLKLRPGQQLHFELGRAVVAQCGSVISRVVYVKEGVGKRFVILDAGMTTLIRPALYGAHHKIENLTSDALELETYDVVGPVCESSDVFGTEEKLPLTRRGDLIALRSAGAYGEVMASAYNCRPLPKAVVTH